MLSFHLDKRGEVFGPLVALYGQVRGRAPHAPRRLTPRHNTPQPSEAVDLVRAAYYETSPSLVVWDGETGSFIWHDGPHAGHQFVPRNDAPDETDNITDDLGASPC
ncbi:hypothetical protein [Actinomadura sp. 9N407]|uniref:hypothetical protein n=1 Tax=Actinomadura sp. 9N407 TaxID=3375154 RepID=UPI0037986C87